MIRDKNEILTERIELDLTGPDGNAFVLMGYASKYAKQLDLDKNKILDEMRESDYDNLVNVFDKYFGNFVTLYR